MPPSKKPAKKAEKKPKSSGDKKTRKKRTESYSSYIYKVLKQVHPDTGISSKAMSIVNSFVNDAFERIAVEAGKLVRYTKKGTLSSREIQTAVRLILPGELAKHAVSEGTKAVTKYTANAGKGGRKGAKKPTSRSAKAGLQFPVSRVHRFLKSGKHAKRYGAGAPVYLAAVLEYMAAEVLELAGSAARDNKKARVTPRHVTLAVRNDEELNKFLSGVTIASGGVIPNIHSVLLPKKSRAGASSNDENIPPSNGVAKKKKKKKTPASSSSSGSAASSSGSAAAPGPAASSRGLLVEHEKSEPGYAELVSNAVAESACNHDEGIKILNDGNWQDVMELSDGMYIYKQGDETVAFLVYLKASDNGYPETFKSQMLHWSWAVAPNGKKGPPKGSKMSAEVASAEMRKQVGAAEGADIFEIVLMCKMKEAEKGLGAKMIAEFEKKHVASGNVIYLGATAGEVSTPSGSRGPVTAWTNLGFTRVDTINVKEGKDKQVPMVKKV